MLEARLEQAAILKKVGNFLLHSLIFLASSPPPFLLTEPRVPL